jgi:hypothetical protein
MEKIEEFGNSSSIHGINYVLTLNNSKTKRIFWLIAILCSICGFCYYVYSAYHRLMIDPEIVMKASDRNSSDFPQPALTICSNLFAKNGMANLTRAVGFYLQNLSANFSKSECDFLEANLHWCDPVSAKYVLKTCPQHLNPDQSVVEMMNKSSSEISDMFSSCDENSCDIVNNQFSRVITDYGICFTFNSLSFSSIFNTETIHDDFKCYLRTISPRKNSQERISNWTPESGYESEDDNFPKRATKMEFLTTFLKLLNKDKNNLCASSSYKIYLHKPNEVATPSHMIEYLDVGEVRILKYFLN